MRISSVGAILILALSVAACGGGSGGDDGDPTAMVGDKGLDVCGLVSDTSVAELQAVSEDKQGPPREDLMSDAETYVECRIVSGVKVGFAVRAIPQGPPAEMLTEGAYGQPSEPLPGVGDQAVIGTNTYDGVRIAASAHGQEVIVDSELNDDHDPEITRDRLIALTKEIISNLTDERPAAIRLPKACPHTTDAKVQDTVGEVIVARGGATDRGVACHYVGKTRHLVLSAARGSRGFNLMAQADSDPRNRAEVDGDPALFDGSQIVVFGDDDCVLSADASEVKVPLAYEKPKRSSRAEAIDLVKYVKKEIGCPS